VKNSFFLMIIFFVNAVKEIHLVDKNICCQNCAGDNFFMSEILKIFTFKILDWIN